jgi:hypothetical protein
MEFESSIGTKIESIHINFLISYFITKKNNELKQIKIYKKSKIKQEKTKTRKILT